MADAVPLRIPLPDVLDALEEALRPRGFSVPRAATCARLFAEASLDGVASHGLGRFPRFVQQIDRGLVHPAHEPVHVATFGAWERWDGRLGPGNLNALACTERAMAIAEAHGIGCVALANTNHWMRGGSYGWHAAGRGAALIAWTNTIPNMPPWGGLAPHLGNNPLVVAVPHGDAPVVLDMAMSQFSYGRMEVLAERGEQLPVPGGFDDQGQLTADPGTVLSTQRVLPAGYWKGAGLSLVLDLLAATLSDGRAAVDIAGQGEEYGVSQVFIALHLPRAGTAAERIVQRVIDDLASAAPADPAHPVRYPGEQVLRTRAVNLAAGVPVDARVWATIQGLCG
jgi:3-dehydro-L-gulonate 2-dehydrogenase